MRARQLLGLIVGVCAILIAAPAVGSAKDGVGGRMNGQGRQFDALEVAVSYADLDLASPAGRKVLSRRIWEAADRICSRSAVTGFDADFIACRDAAIGVAREQVRQATRTSPSP